MFSENKYPNMEISSPVDRLGYDSNLASYEITNHGNAPATNLSITIDDFPSKILNVIYELCTVEAILPEFNNTDFLRGTTFPANSSI